MKRAAILTITLGSFTLAVGCEKKETTSPDDAAAGDAAGDDAVAAEGGEDTADEAKPEADAGGGW